MNKYQLYDWPFGMPERHDPYEINIKDLVIYINNYCNQVCTHCYLPPNEQDIKLEWIQWCLQHFPIEKAIIVGGEPTLSSKFQEICTELKKFDVKISMSTNAKWVKWSKDKPELDKRWRANGDGQLRDIQSVLSTLEQIDSIQISIEGLQEHNDKIRGTGSFENSMKAVALLKELKKDVFFRVTYNRKSLEHVPDLLELAEEQDIPIYFFPYKGKEHPPLSTEQQQWLYNTLYSYTDPRKKNHIALVAIPQFWCYGGEEADYCPAGKERISIMPDGLITPCEMSIPPNHFEIGNFNDEKYKRPKAEEPEAFYYSIKNRLEEFLFNIKTPDLECNMCHHYKYCRSGCLETNEYLTCPLKEQISLKVYSQQMGVSHKALKLKMKNIGNAITNRMGC
jgi:radical SAM protein with 4Fe4S-binding SPASM domain